MRRIPAEKRIEVLKLYPLGYSYDGIVKATSIPKSSVVNIIREFKVIKKFRVDLPEKIIGLIKCTNPTCITRKENEPVQPMFKVITKDPLKIQCEYCGTYLTREDIISQLIH